MQITNNKTTVQLNEQKILDLIMDQRIAKLESVVKTHYQVTKISQLTTEAKNILLYLCVVALDKKAQQLAEIYEVSKHEIVEGVKAVHYKGVVNKQFYAKVYKLYISYKQLDRGVKKHKQVA